MNDDAVVLAVVALLEPFDDAQRADALRMLQGELVRQGALPLRAAAVAANAALTPGVQRAAGLKPLADALEGIELGDWPFPTITRAAYDAVRPPDAASSARLVREHTSWLGACKAAWQVREAHAKRCQPSRVGLSGGRRGVRQGPPYSRDEALYALALCAKETGRRPTWRRYDRWSRERRATARAAGRVARVPCRGVIYRLYPKSEGGWRKAVEDAEGAYGVD